MDLMAFSWTRDSPSPNWQVATEHAQISGRLHEFIFSLFLGDESRLVFVN